MNIGIIPAGEVYLNDKLFDKYDEVLSRDNCNDYLILFKQNMEDYGHEVHTYDLFNEDEIDILIIYRIDFMLSHLLKVLKLNSLCRLFYLMTEPSVVCPMHKYELLSEIPFEYIFTWNDSEIKKSDKIIKLNYVNPRIDVKGIPSVQFSDKKLIASISGNKISRFKNELYSERIKVGKYFSKTSEGFSLYGRGWELCQEDWIKYVWKGSVDSKKDTLKGYKFVLAFENSYGYHGYITEKIFDVFASGAVPVYYGAPNISDYIPKGCFVDYSEFESVKDLYIYLSEMSYEDYNQHLECIKEFVISDTYGMFCSEKFSEVISYHLTQGASPLISNYWSIRLRLFKGLVTKLSNSFYLKRYFFDVLNLLK